MAVSTYKINSIQATIIELALESVRRLGFDCLNIKVKGKKVCFVIPNGCDADLEVLREKMLYNPGSSSSWVGPINHEVLKVRRFRKSVSVELKIQN